MAEMQNPNTDGDSTVLCGANSYVEKYYLNEQFSGLPESIKQELQIMCVMYTEDIGGIILLEFMPDGRLQFKVEAEENDYLFDEIGSALKIKQYQAEKRELLESLELYYKVKVLGIPADELLDDEQMERYQEDWKRRIKKCNRPCADGRCDGSAVPSAL